MAFGNPKLPDNCQDAQFGKNLNFPDFTSTINMGIDLRGIYVQCCSAIPQNYCAMFDWPTTYINSISPISNAPVAFTT